MYSFAHSKQILCLHVVRIIGLCRIFRQYMQFFCLFVCEYSEFLIWIFLEKLSFSKFEFVVSGSLFISGLLKFIFSFSFSFILFSSFLSNDIISIVFNFLLNEFNKFFESFEFLFCSISLSILFILLARLLIDEISFLKFIYSSIKKLRVLFYF